MFFIQNFASSCITHSWIVEQSYSVVVLASPPFTARPEMLMNLQYVLYYIYIYIYICTTYMAMIVTSHVTKLHARVICRPGRVLFGWEKENKTTGFFFYSNRFNVKKNPLITSGTCTLP